MPTTLNVVALGDSAGTGRRWLERYRRLVASNTGSHVNVRNLMGRRRLSAGMRVAVGRAQVVLLAGDADYRARIVRQVRRLRGHTKTMLIAVTPIAARVGRRRPQQIAELLLEQGLPRTR